MNFDEPSERHLTTRGLRDYLDSGAPAAVKVDGQPIGYLIIDPLAARLSMRFPKTNDELPDLSAYQHFSAGVVQWEDASWIELTVQGDGLADAYPVLCAIADRVQLAGLSIPRAVREVIASFHELLAGIRRLSDEQETGLFGELLVLRHLLTFMPEAEALDAWRGPTGEEHDFGFEHDDVEIKTTTSEKRTHWISDVDQLQPTPGRDLWLLSIQLTSAGVAGSTLPELVVEIRDRLAGSDAAATFATNLTAAHWREEQVPLYTRRLHIRSHPALYLVDSNFPSITTVTLIAAGLSPSRFPKVTYVIDLTDYAQATQPPSLLARIAQWGDHR